VGIYLVRSIDFSLDRGSVGDFPAKARHYPVALPSGFCSLGSSFASFSPFYARIGHNQWYGPWAFATNCSVGEINKQQVKRNKLCRGPPLKKRDAAKIFGSTVFDETGSGAIHGKTQILSSAVEPVPGYHCYANSMPINSEILSLVDVGAFLCTCTLGVEAKTCA